MALNSRPSMHPKWPYASRRVLDGFNIAAIEIYRIGLGSAEYDETTNTWDTSEEMVWSGNARIQPTKISSERNVVTNDTFVRQVDFHMAYHDTDIRPGYVVKVTTGGVNPLLESYSYIVRTVIDTSNTWERVITCEVDLEDDPNA